MSDAVKNEFETGFRAFVKAFRERALARQIRNDVFDRAFHELPVLAEVLDRQASQPETRLAIWDYLDRAVSEDRIRNGRKHFRTHRDLLNRIDVEFGVDAVMVSAVWGLETNFGAIRGDMPVIAALATLAAHGRRAAFFEEELISALRILQSGDIGLSQMRGSWAGAMGHGQFMPSSYLDFAVDFDGDGRRDIWADDPTDALASIANYLAKHGWINGQPWGVEVRLPPEFDFARTGPDHHQSVHDWIGLGVEPALDEPIPEYGPASILLPAGAGGVALMVFRNFHVILRYNNAIAYAIAVGHLADRIGGGRAFATEWPRMTQVLERDEIFELQMLLTKAGFDTQGIDGMTGPNTLAAIRDGQIAMGMVADGYPGRGLLERLRAGQSA